MTETDSTVDLSSKKFLAGCVVAALGIWFVGRTHPFPGWVVAAEVLVTVLALFVFGSIRYRLDKNALTYGAVLIIAATFWESWWMKSFLKESFQESGPKALLPFVKNHFLTLHGLEKLIHADTMLFILGLTFFVAAVAQTRLLETLSFAVLRRNAGRVAPTVVFLMGFVAFASGILDGVSMIGLMIRTLVIILFLAGAADGAVISAVIVSTLITTVCGMWLAYGEPPNLIMKTNLHPLLTDGFFLRYCLPAALGSYVIVAWNVYKNLKGKVVRLEKLDILDRHNADVRFLQAARRGEVLTPIEFLEDHRDAAGNHFDAVLQRLHRGVPLGEALVNEDVPKNTRLSLMGKFVSEDLAETLDDYYVHVYGKNDHKADESAVNLNKALLRVRTQRLKSQKIGALAFLPFVGFLVMHALHHEFSLFWASFSGFVTAFLGISGHKKMRSLALREAAHEFKEYLFLLPLFLSITLLQKTGFFTEIENLLRLGVEKMGATHVAYAQFGLTTLLSALLDNNVVADFAGRAIRGLDTGLVHLFAMAQIAGYALGGCWTHIGSAQSVVAYAFIQREVNPHYTPFQWIKTMTPIVLQIGVLMTVIVYLEGALMGILEK